jgi:O-antigen ligase
VNPRFRDPTMANFNQRDVVWEHARMLADQRPVLGYGFGKKAFEKAFYRNPEHRAPLVHFRYPHAHSYWLMLYFQGGAIGLAIWSLGWLALGFGLFRCALRSERSASGWRARLQARVLPVLLGIGIAYILIYGVGDYPDNVIRQSQFYLAALAVALGWPSSAPERGNA